MFRFLMKTTKTIMLTIMFILMLACLYIMSTDGIDHKDYIKESPRTQLGPKPINILSIPYEVVENIVGCPAGITDEAANDYFSRHYKDQYFIWEGRVAMPHSHKALIDMNYMGLADLHVTFKNPKAGYHLKVGDDIKVRFKMTHLGNCALPYAGNEGVIL